MITRTRCFKKRGYFGGFQDVAEARRCRNSAESCGVNGSQIPESLGKGKNITGMTKLVILVS